MEIYNTHRFLFTLNHENKIKDHKIIFLDRNNQENQITINKIEITASPISCRIYDNNGKKHTIPYLRIKKILNKNNELIWDATETDLSNVKIIKGWKKEK